VEVDMATGRYFGVRGGERWDVSADVANVVTDGSGRPMLAKLRNRSWIPLWLSDRLGLTEELATYVADLVGEPGPGDLYPKEEVQRRAAVRLAAAQACLETERREAAAREREAIEAGARELEETGRYGIPSDSLPGGDALPDENPNFLR